MNKNYIKKIWCTDLGLSPFSNNQFYNILECIIIGWKLIPMPNKSEYKPHLVFHYWYGKLDTWIDSLSNFKNNREHYIANIQKNSKAKELLSIKRISFI